MAVPAVAELVRLAQVALHRAVAVMAQMPAAPMLRPDPPAATQPMAALPMAQHRSGAMPAEPAAQVVLLRTRTVVLAALVAPVVQAVWAARVVLVRAAQVLKAELAVSRRAAMVA
jgi:hypothetical protein